MSENSPPKSKLELKPIEVGVGAGAAVVTAFASSYLGIAGTLTGAALASVVGTVSTSVLRTSAQRTNESLQRSTSRLRQAMVVRGTGTASGATRVDPGVAAVDVTGPAGTAGNDPDRTAAAEAAGAREGAGAPGRTAGSGASGG